jgi:hypothetical protein
MVTVSMSTLAVFRSAETVNANTFSSILQLPVTAPQQSIALDSSTNSTNPTNVPFAHAKPSSSRSTPCPKTLYERSRANNVTKTSPAAEKASK